MFLMLPFTFELLIYVSLGQKKVITFQNDTFILKHSIEKQANKQKDGFPLKTMSLLAWWKKWWASEKTAFLI